LSLLKESSDKIYTNSGNEDVLGLITQPGSIILDVGCGSGSLAKILSAEGHKMDGITISAEEYAIAQEYLNNLYLYDLEKGLPVNMQHLQYDYVICSHVLEHIVYPEKLLRDIYSVLKPGGFLIVALPNIMHYKSRLKLLAGKFDYQEAGIWDNTHVKWYTFVSAKKLLIEYGFLIELATVTGELPFNRLFSKILPLPIRKGIFNLLTKISKGFFGYQLLLKAKKA
jgi:2-polyprenyl-3-methyl-5-hydroxy-6-metoxy-1,4-benzoquinol methylase